MRRHGTRSARTRAQTQVFVGDGPSRPASAARRDFIVHYVYIVEKAGFDTAKRFRQAVESAYAYLVKMPRMGVPYKIKSGKHAGVRIWRVRGFPDYLIAYRPYRGGVRIERLVHAKQDYQRALKR